MKAERQPDETREQFQRRRDKELAEYEQEREREELRYILDDPKGRRFLWRLLDYAGVYNSSFTGNSFTFFNEGRRDVGLFVLDEVTDADPDAYLEMQRESLNEAREAEKQAEEEESDD